MEFGDERKGNENGNGNLQDTSLSLNPEECRPLNGTNKNAKIEKFEREYVLSKNSGQKKMKRIGCLDKTANACRLTPKKSLIYLIVCGIIIFILALAIVYLVAFSSSRDDNRNRPTSFCISSSLSGSGKSGDAVQEFTSSLISKGKNISDELLIKMNSDVWKYKKKGTKGDKAYIHTDGEIYKIIGTLQASPETINDILFVHADKTPDWNKDNKNMTLIKKLDDSTQIYYQQTHEIGPVSIRSFLFLGHSEKLPANEGIIYGFESVILDEEIVENEETVRGFFGISGWLLKQSPESKNLTNFEFVLDANFKMGWVPFWDTLMIKGVQDTINYLRDKLDEDNNSR